MNQTAPRLLNPDEKQSKQKNLVKSDNFVCLQGWMITELHLKGASLIIYAIIYSFSQDNSSYFQGSASYLSEWASVSVYTVYDILKKLCQLNLIEKIEENINGVKICNYRSKRTPPVVKDHHPGDKRTPPPVIKDQLDNIDNNIVNNINKKTIQKSVTYSQLRPEDQDQIFCRFWELYPRQRRGSKQKAYKAWLSAQKRENITGQQILSTVEAYAKSDEVKRGYAKGCEAWLNDSRFLCNYENTTKGRVQSFLEDIVKDSMKQDIVQEDNQLDYESEE